MSVTDFAILANITSDIIVTLPAAYAGGFFGACIGEWMIVFIKNISTAAATPNVTVVPHSSSDSIEGNTTRVVLSKKYDS
jgi:hypothetical protein